MSDFEIIQKKISVRYPSLKIANYDNWQQSYAKQALKYQDLTLSPLELFYLNNVANRGIIATNVMIRMQDMSQVDLALKTGISKQNINNILKGTQPQVLTLDKIATALGCSMQDLTR